MSLRIDNLRVSYGSTRALDGISIALEPGEMFFLLGPSGCGKSTLLRTVAGFIEEFDGDIQIEGRSLKGVPTHLRDFGMVFQNYALFPHMTVDGNVGFGLEARKVPADERKKRVAEALQMALRRRRPPGGGDLLHHSDRGVQYACDLYRGLLAGHDVTVSMSRPGNCYDNACVESFFGTFKTELVHREHYRTRAEARSSVFEWIECWYNRRRRHSSLGYVSPEAFEAQTN